MASKLSENGMYEGSRLILPEHRGAYLAQEELQRRRGKPVLDEQEMHLIEEAIFESYQECRTVTLTVFSPFDDEELRGSSHQLTNQTGESKLNAVMRITASLKLKRSSKRVYK
ncbi:YolD-like family protein [Paenibacillus xylanexedens]|uniref:YolD-like family protein n=1 Tax=Paenibacillus xylanexedens TaxID=528191 RepID=UPI0021B5CB42|nr:YolD-like family protein [Paenibacillus xylanexedens]